MKRINALDYIKLDKPGETVVGIFLGRVETPKWLVNWSEENGSEAPPYALAFRHCKEIHGHDREALLPGNFQLHRDFEAIAEGELFKVQLIGREQVDERQIKKFDVFTLDSPDEAYPD